MATAHKKTRTVAAGEPSPEDERVAFVKRNWMGRFLRAEVNYGDYGTIAARIATWEQWLPAWVETAESYERHAEAAEKEGARHSAAEA